MTAPPPAEPSHGHEPGHDHGHSHSHGDGHDHGWAPWRYVVLLLPVVLYFLILSNPIFFNKPPVPVPETTLDRVHNFFLIFCSILWEALPFIILGAVVAGLLEELLPQQALARILPRNRTVAIGLGGLLGLAFPMCECGIVPVMRRLLRKGLPLSCCVAYLLAGPIINVVVLLSTYVAFSGMENAFEGGKPSYQMGGPWMMGFRAGIGYLVAVVTALIVEGLHRRHGNDLLTEVARPSSLPVAENEGGEKRSLWQRIRNITETATHDFLDITVFLIMGALLAATARMFISQESIADLSRQHVALAILMMMALAVVLCLCSEADAFVAASFVTLRPSAKLAFLVLGPMLDFKLYLMYTRVFRPRLIWTIYLAVITQVFLYCYLAHLVWEAYAPWLITPQQVQASRLTTEKPAQLVARDLGLMASPHGNGPLLIWAMREAEASKEEVAEEIGFLQLEMAAITPEARNIYKGRPVSLVGRFVEIDGKRFSLQRYRINCCAADGQLLKSEVWLDGETTKEVPVGEYRKKWVKVVGTVDFLPTRTGSYFPIVRVRPTGYRPLDTLIEVVDQPANPYIY